MSATEEGTTSRGASVGRVDMKLEVQVIPVSDVVTPPGSGTSVDFGQGSRPARPARPRVR